MDIEQELLREHSKRNAVSIAAWIGKDAKRFRQLMSLFLNGEYLVTQRSAWVLSICAENHPALIPPHLKKMVKKMQQPGVHDAVKRNVVRILRTIAIPRDMLGTVATICFDYLSSPHEPIAVKAFSMTVLARIAQQEPDLQKELKLIIDQRSPYESAGFRACARRTLKLLEPG